MKKETFIELLKKGYSWLIEKGMKTTIAKVLIGAIFGVVCAFCFSSCSLHYSDNERQLNIEVLNVERGQK